MKRRLPHVSQLRIANFRPFRSTQVIPLRPITLIYGPNSAGKSSILKALRWISSLNTPGSIDDFRVHVHARDLERQIQFAVLLPSSKFVSHCRFYPELEEAFHSVILESSDIVLEANIGRPTLVPREVRVQRQESPFDPCVTFTRIIIGGMPFLTARQTYTTRHYAPYATEYSEEVTLHVQEINTAHPWTRSLLNAAKSLLINRTKFLSEFKAAVAKAKGTKPAYRKSATKTLREIRATVAAIKQFDAESILRWYGMRGMRLHARRLPPQFIAPPAEVFASESQQVNIEETRIETPNLTETPELLLPKAFELCLFALLEAFNDSLGFARLHDSLRAFGPTRSVPNASFSEKSRERDAPEWPTLSESNARLANQWLKNLARPETRYEFVVREKHARSRRRDVRGSDTHAEFLGIKDISRKLLLPLSDVGAGFGQIAPILLSAFSDKAEALLIEQPELHLHPAVQAELADLFIERSLGNDSGEPTKQFIIETHSEHILLRLMRRIRESSTGRLPEGFPPVSADEIAVLYVEPRGTESVVLEMPLDELGRLTRDWPGGFFEEGIREVLM